MKIRRNVFLLVLIQISSFCSSNKLNPLAVNETKAETFMEHVNSMKQKIPSGTFKMNMSTVTGVLGFSDWIKSMYSFISTYSIVDDNLDKKLINDLCNNRKKLEVAQLVCFMKYMTNVTYYESTEWKSSLNNLLEKQKWFQKLVLFYENGTHGNETYISHESERLNEEISENSGHVGDFMQKAFTTINDVVNVKLNSSCSPLGNGTYKLQVEGKFLNFGQILHKNYCSGKKVVLMELLALDKIIINEDFRGERMQIIIIAPIWEIISNRIINLDGAPAINSWRPQKMLPLFISDHRGYIDGLPGLPGETGGSFFGIYDTVIAEGNLLISSNGGKGGNGQDGADGLFVFLPETGSVHHKYDLVPIYSKYIHVPGAGGKRGQGGLHGCVKLFSLNNSIARNIQTSLKNGTDGKNGLDGNYKLCVDQTCGYIIINKQNEFKKRSSSETRRQMETYRKMKERINKSDLSRTEPIGLGHCKIQKNSVVKYRKFVISNMMGIGTSGYEHLYKKLNNLVNFLNLTDFIEELSLLEHYYSRKLNTSLSIFIFSAYQEGINQCRENSENNQESNGDEKWLSKLKNMTSGRLSRLKRRNSANSVLNINLYLEQSIVNTRGFRSMEVLNMIDGISQVLKIYTDIEIREVKKLMNNLDLKENTANINGEIESLAEELNRMVNLETQTTEDLEKKRKVLFEKLTVQTLFSIVQVLCKAALFIYRIAVEAKSDLRTRLASTKIIFNESFLPVVKLPETERNFFRNSSEVEREINKIISMFVNNVNNNETDKEVHDFSRLENFKHEIEKVLDPEIKQLRMDLQNTIVPSMLFFKKRKFQMNNYLLSISSELDTWIENLKIGNKVTKTMENVKSLLNSINRIFTLIEDFPSKIKNVENSKNMFSSFGINVTKDSNISQILTNLEQIQYSNDIIKDYNMLIIAMKGYTYPFSSEFVPFTSNPTDLFSNSIIKASIELAKMKHLKSDFNRLKSYGKTLEGDINFVQEKFGNQYTISEIFGIDDNLPAFYTWSNSSHSSDIKQILQGEEVVLFANISHRTEFNAVKFRDVGILFTSTDPEIKKNMKKDFKFFTATLTHHGNSYYRCMDKVHLIESEASVWKKMLFISGKVSLPNNDYILSPYATWSIRLESSAFNGTSYAYDSLAKYVDKVNIQLVGQGQIMLPNRALCNNDFTKSYGKEVLLIS